MITRTNRAKTEKKLVIFCEVKAQKIRNFLWTPPDSGPEPSAVFIKKISGNNLVLTCFLLAIDCYKALFLFAIYSYKALHTKAEVPPYLLEVAYVWLHNGGLSQLAL